MDPQFAIDRTSGIAAWRQIADRLGAALRAGEFDSTGMLPPETTLASQFGVNRHTVRSAIAALAEDGLLRRVQGRGTLIEKAERLVFPISRRTRFSEGLEGKADERALRVLAARQVPATEDVATALEIAIGSPVVVMETLGLASRQAVSLATSYFPADRFAAMADDVRATGSVTRAFIRQGVPDYMRRSTEVIGRTASEAESRLLGLPARAVVLETRSINVDLEGRPVQYARTAFAADRVSLRLDTEAGGLAS